MAICLLCAGLGGCAAVRAPDLPEGDVPETWQGPLVEDAEVWPGLEWWENFGEDELNAIVQQVRESNLTLENNRRNLEAAQIALEEAGFDLLPTPSLVIGTGARYSENLGASEADSTPRTPVDLAGSLDYNDILSKPARWRGAVADYELRRAQVADTALNTLGTAASTYFQILLIRDRIEAAQQNVANAEAIGDITQARVDAGVAVPIEALQQRIAIQEQRTNLQSLRQDELAARASLALLLGRSMQGFDVQGQTLETVTVPALRPGIPSQLLRRRPDLVQAEASLRAAAADTELARLDFFPSIALTGGASASSTSLTELVSSPDAVLTLGADLSQVLLDNGRRSRNLEQSRLTLENSLNGYRSAVIGAFNEVEVLLSNIRLLEEQEAVALSNLEAAEESFRIAQVRYEEGVADFQTVLTTQNTLFSSRTAYLNSKIRLLNAMVGFYQALGGGWDADDAETMRIAGE